VNAEQRSGGDDERAAPEGERAPTDSAKVHAQIHLILPAALDRTQI
jgi:hypothetical protein